MFPNFVYDRFNSSYNEAALTFEFDDLLTGEKISNETLEGKVNIISFFGTWCGPCIAESKELIKLRKELLSYEQEINYIMVNTGYFDDTPEKAKQFHAKRTPDFMLAYDKSAKYFEQIGEGHPTLLILDKIGNLRHKHVGFEPAENMNTRLKPIVEELLSCYWDD